MIELRQQLDKERSVRMMLEEQVRCPLWAGCRVPQAGRFCGLCFFCLCDFHVACIYRSPCSVPGLGVEI